MGYKVVNMKWVGNSLWLGNVLVGRVERRNGVWHGVCGLPGSTVEHGGEEATCKRKVEESIETWLALSGLQTIPKRSK